MEEEPTSGVERGATRWWVLPPVAGAVALVGLGQWALASPTPGVVGWSAWVAGLVLFGALATGLPAPPPPTDDGGGETRLLPRLARWELGVLAAGLGAFVWTTVRRRAEGADHTDVVVAWIALVVALAFCVVGTPRLPRLEEIKRWGRRHQVEIGAVAAVCLAALALRVWRLGSYPWTFSSDESQFGLGARQVLDGTLTSPFASGWLSHPTMYMFAEAGALRVVGDTVTGARTVSALLGTATVAVTYLAARRLLGPRVALVASTLLAAFHVHLFFSRNALNNVGDSLFVMLTLLLVDLGIVGRRRGSAFAAGLVVGLGQYCYFGARLLPVIAAALVLHAAVVGDGRGKDTTARLRGYLPFAGLAVVGAVAALLPFAAYAVDHWDDVQGRQRQVSVLESGWLEQEQEDTGESAPVVMARHAGQAALLPFHTEPHGFYRGGVPFVGWPVAVPAALGLAVATFGIGRRQYGGILVAFWVAVAGLTLTEGNPPQTHRFGAVLAPLCVLAAVGIVTAARLTRTTATGVVVTAAIAVWSVGSYFDDPNRPELYSDPNTQVAMTLAADLRTADDVPTVYFAGAPRMWLGGFGNVDFLAPDAAAAAVDLDTPLTERPVLVGPTRFVFLPERIDELALVRDWYPTGTRHDVEDENGHALYTEWSVNP